MTNHRYIKGKRKDKTAAKRKVRRHVAKSAAQPGIARRIDSHSPRPKPDDGLYESMPSPTLPEGDPFD